MATLACSLAGRATGAESCIDYGKYLHLLGSLKTPGAAYDVAVSGSYAYIPADTSGLQIIDVSDANTPVRVGHLATPVPIYGIAVSDSLVFLTGPWGIRIIDVSNPRAAWLIGGLGTSSPAFHLVTQDSLAFVADDASGLIVVDINDPADPFVVGRFQTYGRARGVAISGNLGFVLSDTTPMGRVDLAAPTSRFEAKNLVNPASRLEVLDLSNPASPSLIGSLDLLAFALDLDVSGSYVYVSGGGLVHVIDVRTPASPKLVDYIAPVPGGWVSRTAISAHYLFLADEIAVESVDIADPTHPRTLGVIGTPNYPYGIAILGTRVYVACSRFGLQIIDISYPGSPTPIGQTPANFASDLVISDSYAYVLNAGSGLQILDIADPSSVGTIGSLSMPGDASGLAVSAPWAFVADGFSGLEVVDLSNPSSPEIRRTFETPFFAYAVGLSGSFAYVAEGGAGLQTIDITDPAAPKSIGNLSTRGSPQNISIFGQRAYLAEGGSGIEIVDLSNPTLPRSIGSIDTPGFAWDIAISGSYAFVADDGAGIQIVDVSSPTIPKIVGHARTLGLAVGIAIRGSVAYVADSSGLSVFDISNPLGPQFLGSAFARFTRAIFVTDSFVCLAGSELIFLPLHCSPSTPVQLAFLTASTEDAGILLTWDTISESEFVGFRVMRSLEESGHFGQIDSGIISHPSPYRFLDTHTVSGVTYFYELMALDRTGGNEIFGPVSARSRSHRKLHPTLGQSFPNPSRGEVTTIPFSLKERANVTVGIFDCSGTQVKLLLKSEMPEGDHTAYWDGRNEKNELVPSGVYFYSLQILGSKQSRRLIRLP